MSAEDFRTETARERHEDEHEARTLEQEIADLKSDLDDLDADLTDKVAEIAALRRGTVAMARARDFYADMAGLQAFKLEILRAEHDAGRIMRAVPDTRSADFIDAYRPWADAHDRTELAR